MAPRAYWKGYLKLSLVSCPIALYPASSSSERVSFNRPVDHQAFQIAGRYPPAARTVPSRPGEEGSRNIVPISRFLLDRIGWRQALAGRVKHHTGQQTGMPCPRSRCPLNPVCSQHGLDIVPQRLVDNRRVFSGIGVAFVWYLAAVKPVLKNQIKCPTGELLTSKLNS